MGCTALVKHPERNTSTSFDDRSSRRNNKPDLYCLLRYVLRFIFALANLYHFLSPNLFPHLGNLHDDDAVQNPA